MKEPSEGQAVDVPRVSVAAPVFNEETAVEELVQRTVKVLNALPGGPHELLIVDDGSTDGTRARLQEAASREPLLRLLFLSRNFGHQAALTAALDHASGDVVVLMDGDLQDEPEVIPRFLEGYAAGHDVVYAVRTKRKEGLLKRVCYSAAYRLIALLGERPPPVGAGDFSLMSRRVVEALKATPERNRYLRGLRNWVGFSQLPLEVERAARHSGNPKYSFRHLFRLALDGLFAFSTLPLRAASVVGALAVLSACGYSVFALYAKLVYGSSPQGFTTLILALVFFSGVQLLSLGIIGEYVGRVYEEVKSRPHYVVSDSGLRR